MDRSQNKTTSNRRSIRKIVSGHSACRHNDSVKGLLSVLLVVIMLVSSLPLIIGTDETEGVSENTTTVVYHMYKPGEKPDVDSQYNSSISQNDDSIPSITVQYSGIVSTEYNPQKWSGTIKGTIASGSDSDWFQIKEYKTGSTLVFTGWVYQKGTGTQTTYSAQSDFGHYPGEVLNDPDQYSLINGAIHIYATWGKLENYAYVSDSSALSSSSIGTWNSDGNPFTNILELSAQKFTLKGDAFGKPLTLTGQGEGTVLALNGQASMTDDCIMDSVSIRHENQVNGNHGYGTSIGLYANGHTLVLGTGLSASLSESEANSGGAVKYMLQVIGGSNSNSVEQTDVIIHSGYYYTVVAGGQNSGVKNDTMLTIRGGMVLDTVVGGCSGSGTVGGSTHVYLIGDAMMPGDYYEEKSLDRDYKLVIGSEIKTVESSILTGGSNKSSVSGDTFAYISNDAQAWDVQGAGRGGKSTVAGTANVYVSGNALIKHVVNGSITDGLNGNDSDGSPDGANECVKNTNIVISDNAKVASVFGAGYDTFYSSKYSSMYSGGKISITIEGGTVGYVYGGGYRGTIGAKDNGDTTAAEPLDSISIDIRGGTVLYDVFGGGRGGLDKVCHNSNGSINWGSSYSDTVGHSRVFVKDLNIDIGANATVRGNVYGGGESTPIITGYDSYSASLGGSDDSRVAAVICDNLAIAIDGKVEGSVFGAGKGVDLDDTTDGRHSSAYIFSMDSDGNLRKIPWIASGTSSSASTSYSSDDMSGFASMNAGSIALSIGSTADIGDSIYGGGALGTTSGKSSGDGLDIAISVEGAANIRGSVYGGGMGQDLKEDDAGRIDADSIKIDIKGGTISQSVYGGGAQSRTTSGSIRVVVGNSDSATAVGIAGSVYGGGMGSTSLVSAGYTKSDISVIVNNDASVKGSVFGGGQLAQIEGNVVTEIHANINGNVFGGGLGSQSSTSTVNTKRTVKICNGARIGGSVFGSSSLGNDAISNGSSSSSVIILGGTVEGSVFGGGLKGTTYGSTSIEAFSDADIRIEGSIYGGADIGNNDDTSIIGTTLVHGDSTITVEKKTGALYIGGSVFGSGNSCLVSGTKNVSVKDLTDSTMQSFQNIDALAIESSDITLVGRTSGESSQVSTIHSLRNINDLVLVAGTSLELRVSAVNIGSLTSCISGGILSDVSAPSNKIVVCDGHIISVNYGGSYGSVSGYTIVQSDMNSENDGIYIYGSTSSSGGFVTINDGIFERMYSADFDQPDSTDEKYRCWYMKGGITRNATIVADGSHSEGETTSTKAGSISIPKMNSSSRLVFYGYEVKIYNQAAFTLVESDPDSNINQYMMRIGSFSSIYDEDAKGFLTLHPNSMTASKTFALDSDRMDYILSTSTSITYTGKVAEITILLWESTDANVPMNPVYLKVEIHAQSLGIGSEYRDTVSIKNGAGESKLVINRGHTGAILKITGIEWNDMSVTGDITIGPSINVENTDGWVTPLAAPLDLSKFDASEGYVLGELSGSFSATLNVTVSGMDQIPSGSVTIRMMMVLEDGTTIETSLILDFEATETCVVKFVFWKFSSVNGKVIGEETAFETTVYQGDVLPKNSIPQVDYLTGWYTSELYEIPFDFNAPIHGTGSDGDSTNTLTIYARQGFMATFDNGDGTQGSSYVPFAMNDGAFDLDDGRLYGILSSPGTPSRNDSGDYTFHGWMDSASKEFPFIAGGSKIRIYSDMSFVADWTGKTLEVIFKIRIGTTSYTEYTGKLMYGQTYSEVIFDKNDEGVGSWEDVTAKAKEKGGDLNKFIRWVHGNTPVFGDMTTIDAVSPHELIAEFTVNAIEILFDDSTMPSDFGEGKDYDYDATLTVQAPKDMIVFIANGKYSFTPGNAYLKGYHLNYWTDGSDNRYYVGKEYSLTPDEASELTDRKLTLSPVFEHQRYTLTVDQPLSGSVTATPASGAFDGQDRSNGGIVYYSDRIKLEFTGGDSSWNVKGEGKISYEEDGAYLTVYGDCRVYALYTAFRLELRIDGTIAPDNTRLKLENDNGLAYELKSLGGGAFETNSLRGNYKLYIYVPNSDWLLIDEFIGIEMIDDPVVELFSITGNRTDFDFPKYAKNQSTVEIVDNRADRDHGCIVICDYGTSDERIVAVGNDPTFTITGKTRLVTAYIIDLMEPCEGVTIDGAERFGTTYYVTGSKSITFGYDGSETGWKVIGWFVSSDKSNGISDTSEIKIDRNTSIRPVFELDSPSDEITDLGTFSFAMDESHSGLYSDLTPIEGIPPGGFSMSFSDYGGVTLTLKDGKLDIEGLADATGTVYFPDIMYESDGKVYRATFVLYIVSDITPTNESFTLTSETETSYKRS